MNDSPVILEEILIFFSFPHPSLFPFKAEAFPEEHWVFYTRFYFSGQDLYGRWSCLALVLMRKHHGSSPKVEIFFFHSASKAKPRRGEWMWMQFEIVVVSLKLFGFQAKWEIRSVDLPVPTIFKSCMWFEWPGSSNSNLCMSIFSAVYGVKSSCWVGKEEAANISL